MAFILDGAESVSSIDIGVSPVTILTVPASPAENRYAIASMMICNTDAGTVKYTVTINDSSASDQLVNIGKDVDLAAGSHIDIADNRIFISPGDVVKVTSDTATSLDVWLSYGLVDTS